MVEAVYIEGEKTPYFSVFVKHVLPGTLYLMVCSRVPASCSHFAEIDTMTQDRRWVHIEKSSIHSLKVFPWSPLSDIGFKLSLFFRKGKHQNVDKWLIKWQWPVRSAQRKSKQVLFELICSLQTDNCSTFPVKVMKKTTYLK